MEETEWKRSRLWVEGNKIYQENGRFFLSFFDKAESLLDLGCLDGRFTREIAAKTEAARVFGVDLGEDDVKAARKNGVNAVVGDLNLRFPFDDSSFDVVSAHQVLEHLGNTSNFFKETYRVLRPGGYAVISVPNLSSLHSIAFVLLGWQPTVLHLVDVQVGNPLRGTKIEQPGHLKAFNYAAIRDLAEIHGFKVEKLGGFGIHFLPITLQKILSKPLGRWSIFITAKIRKPR